MNTIRVFYNNKQIFLIGNDIFILKMTTEINLFPEKIFTGSYIIKPCRFSIWMENEEYTMECIYRKCRRLKIKNHGT